MNNSSQAVSLCFSPFNLHSYIIKTKWDHQRLFNVPNQECITFDCHVANLILYHKLKCVNTMCALYEQDRPIHYPFKRNFTMFCFVKSFQKQVSPFGYEKKFTANNVLQLCKTYCYIPSPGRRPIIGQFKQLLLRWIVEHFNKY